MLHLPEGGACDMRSSTGTSSGVILRVVLLFGILCLDRGVPESRAAEEY